jgi:hypothetical protein
MSTPQVLSIQFMIDVHLANAEQVATYDSVYTNWSSGMCVCAARRLKTGHDMFLLYLL